MVIDNAVASIVVVAAAAAAAAAAVVGEVAEAVVMSRQWLVSII